MSKYFLCNLSFWQILPGIFNGTTCHWFHCIPEWKWNPSVSEGACGDDDRCFHCWTKSFVWNCNEIHNKTSAALAPFGGNAFADVIPVIWDGINGKGRRQQDMLWSYCHKSKAEHNSNGSTRRRPSKLSRGNSDEILRLEKTGDWISIQASYLWAVKWCIKIHALSLWNLRDSLEVTIELIQQQQNLSVLCGVLEVLSIVSQKHKETGTSETISNALLACLSTNLNPSYPKIDSNNVLLTESAAAYLVTSIN